jgi:hypothetical protein
VLLQRSVLQLADRVAGGLGLLGRPFNADRLMALAARRSVQRDFGDVSFLEPLQHLLQACAEEAALSVVGRMATRWDVVRFLTNLLILHDAEQRDPTVLRETIGRPIIITGLPRSGTTFLHRLLIEDAQHRAPRVWETIHPYKLSRITRDGRDTRPALVARQLRAFEFLAPEFRSLHPLDTHSPQECSEITAHVFRSLRFDTTYRVPSYRAWLDGAGHLSAYQFHRRFLQHLQHQDAGGSWVLKCPDHLFALQAIRAVYPDARLVFVHRDPVKVLMSVTKLTEVLRRPFTRRIDRGEIGHQESARWLEGAQRMIEAGNDAGLPQPIHHVHYEALVADPVGTVAAVYEHFGLELRPAAASAISTYVRQRPNGGYATPSYCFEDYGLDAGAERDKFRAYMQRFGVASEPVG